MAEPSQILAFNPFNIANWYWQIADDASQFWSSAKAAFVPASDPDYVLFASVTVPTPIATIEELENMFANAYPRGSLKTYTAFKRWEKEQAGMVTTSGIPVKTDDRSQAKINGTRLVAVENPALVTRWRASDGTYHDVDSAGIIAMSDDLQIHVNNCFAIASDCQEGIDDGSITTHQQIDDMFNAPIRQDRADWLKKKPPVRNR